MATCRVNGFPEFTRPHVIAIIGDRDSTQFVAFAQEGPRPSLVVESWRRISVSGKCPSRRALSAYEQVVIGGCFKDYIDTPCVSVCDPDLWLIWRRRTRWFEWGVKSFSSPCSVL